VGNVDINEYANRLLLDFLDAFHECLTADVKREFGDDWLDLGVRKHLDSGSLDRTRQMLSSPMRVVDMNKTDEELFGVEHLAPIVTGNWKVLGYDKRFGDRDRTRVYLGEVAEVRHNVSHRRQRHFLRRAELLRFVSNCEMLLRAIGSDQADRFALVVESLSAGNTPWGATLLGYLPPQDEVVEEFLGRPHELRSLTTWLAGDSPQLLVWGYGGAGKSSLAYEFAREAKEMAPGGLSAVCWVSAKATEYVEGEPRARKADFSDRTSFVDAVFNAVYETDGEETVSESDLLELLGDMPILLVVDDFDTVLTDDDLVEFVMHDVRGTGARVLYTSRQKVAGLRSLEILGFSPEDLREFVRARAIEYELDSSEAVKRCDAIQSVTGGFPLFVDDLLRHARLGGIKAALGEWSQRRGDAAREYALRRQLEALGQVTQDVLLAVSVSSRPLTTIEVATLAGLTDDDAEHAIRDLLDWRLVNRIPHQNDNRPGFTMNSNTRRLVLRTYGQEPRVAGFRSKFKALGSERAPAARSSAVSSAVGIAKAHVVRGDPDSAVRVLQERMTGELHEEADLWGALGWAHSRRGSSGAGDAERAFQEAFDRGSTREDTYYHWASMLLRVAEDRVGTVSDTKLLEQWRRAGEIAELGIKACGATQALCQLAGYAHTREAKTLERLNEFTQAQGAYAEAVAFLKRGLTAPPSRIRSSSRGSLYRSLIHALEGYGKNEEVLEIATEWSRSGIDQEVFDDECRRLTRRFPAMAEPLGDLGG
jgi:hypothetical protein